MLDFKIRLVAIVIVILGFFSLTGLIKKRKVELKYALIWYAAGVFILIFTLFPKLMGGLSKLLGIVTPVNMLFMLAIVVLSAIVMELTAVVSASSKRIRRLVQEVALLKEAAEKEETADGQEEMPVPGDEKEE